MVQDGVVSRGAWRKVFSRIVAAAANFSSTVWYYHGVTRVSRMQEGGCV